MSTKSEDKDRNGSLDRLVDQSLLSPEEIAATIRRQEEEAASRGSLVRLDSQSRRRRRWALLLAFLGLYVAGTVVVLQRYASVPVERPTRAVVAGDWLYRDGHKFLVKGVGWDPARPGELPWARSVSVDLVDDDFGRIRAAGFNTVRTWDAMSWEELAAAERHGLAVLQGIWIEPDGDFGSAEFRRRALKKVRDIVGFSRESRAVIGYLVMNEPEAEHVLDQGVEETREFLHLLASEVRQLDPVGLVAFSNWPGTEFLNEPDLDFAAVNLYPFRPTGILQAVGYEGMVRIWKALHGQDRPLLVTEYGVSVSPQPPTEEEAPGGLTEAEQAEILPRLAAEIIEAGAAGGAVFSWIDGWWKGQERPGDENVQDPDDAEEWFGLVAMETAGNPKGRDRPALDAMRRWNRAVVTSPRNGPVAAREVLLEVHAEDDKTLRAAASVNGTDAVAVPLTREGPWFRGRIGLALQREGAQRVEVFVHDEKGGMVAHVKRVVFPPGQVPALSLSVLDRESGVVEARATDGRGDPLPDAEVRLAVASAEGTHGETTVARTGNDGTVRVMLELPDREGVFLVAGLWQVPGEPPSAVRGMVVP